MPNSTMILHLTLIITTGYRDTDDMIETSLTIYNITDSQGHDGNIIIQNDVISITFGVKAQWKTVFALSDPSSSIILQIVSML